MEYVVKSDRLKNYLYALGLNYRTIKDRDNSTKDIYLFKNDDKLKTALTFYNTFKKTFIKSYK